MKLFWEDFDSLVAFLGIYLNVSFKLAFLDLNNEEDICLFSLVSLKNEGDYDWALIFFKLIGTPNSW